MIKLLSPSLPRSNLRNVFLAGLGSFIAIAILALLAQNVPFALLVAPFGASCVLLFAAPSAPLSQPLNVIAGHLVATLTGLAFHAFWASSWWSVALAVGCATAFMVALRVTHPPAGADPLVVFAADPGIGFLFAPVLAGSVILVLVAMTFHRLNGTAYPNRIP
ncbi:HPP family protein [Celeribacter ethanolicus]|uniref:HPP family protein n=1 Tax=Celeribacter ethanolicus TaxID=1758178 RepID=UPI0008377335|nr:HPP family protein [Celeribacter ethanolicus]